MTEAVYIGCAIASLICAYLMFSAYKAKPARLPFWTGVCFFGLFLNNVFLVVDLLLVPQIDLSPIRLLCGLVPSVFLIYAFVRDSV